MNPDFEITPEQAAMLVAQVQTTVEEQEAGSKTAERDLGAYRQHLDELDAILSKNVAEGAEPEESEPEIVPPPPDHLVPAGQIPISASSLLYG